MLVKQNKQTINSKDDSGYIDPVHLSKTDKSGIMVITEMPTRRILWYATKKHKLALFVMGNFAQAYVYWHAPIMAAYHAIAG